MTDHLNTTAEKHLAKALISADSLNPPADAYKAVTAHALVSIAASLHEVVNLLRPPASGDPVTLPPAELVVGGCCSAAHAIEADDLLELGFGLVCNADHSISSGGRVRAEWDEAARRFIDAYNAMLSRRFGGSLEHQLSEARAELAALKATYGHSVLAEMDERSAD